ncbi:FAD-binding oxidoreductase [Vibrio breoganii]|uniref:FAD-binding oxidoreductase n=1 Tax=Vibrio breoganii TaxID=553239 RepID=UPI000C81C873|nr:FAD-binding oxidoreductase [Vibrio breoganii]PMG94668.1 FAD-linked oxidase [Vibrio breoganii]
MEKLTSWGKSPIIECEVSSPCSKNELQSLKGPAIARGLGRSYGDSALYTRVIRSGQFQRFISFDQETGLLRCESGVTLDDILDTFVPKGWFLSVTPGTKFVSVGGAIASDVHGKNHHIEGTFCDHVTSLSLMIDDKEYICSPDVNSDLFRATCGGMGLTGVITEATFRLKPIASSFIEQKVIKAKDLKTVLRLFEEYEESTYSVAWIDCLSTGEHLGRSLLMLGEHANDGRLSTHKRGLLNVPCNMPSFLLNKFTIQAFNHAYYSKQLKQEVNETVHYDSFFYPLDSIHNWNRMYGKDGFTQYQFVIPKTAGLQGLTEILKTIAESKQGSFLAVLKVFGKENSNLLSFPIEGYTLALDFKLTRKVCSLLEQLDVVVKKYKGRLYLSKDVRMSEDMFKSSYSNWEDFQNIRKRYAANLHYHSIQSNRIGL